MYARDINYLIERMNEQGIVLPFCASRRRLLHVRRSPLLSPLSPEYTNNLQRMRHTKSIICGSIALHKLSRVSLTQRMAQTIESENKQNNEFRVNGHWGDVIGVEVVLIGMYRIMSKIDSSFDLLSLSHLLSGAHRLTVVI